MDSFANFVIQKILEMGFNRELFIIYIGNQIIKDKVYKKVKNHVKELTFHTYGCRVI